MKNSNIKIGVECDICKNRKFLTYCMYNKNIKNYNIYTCSTKCGIVKYKMTCFEKYGVENVSQSEEIKEKKKETCFKNYGVENPNQSEEIKAKKKETCLNKYCAESPLESEEIKNKIKQTNLEKYGFENPNKSEEIKNKISNTNIEKYGFKTPFQNEDIKDKIKQTCFKNYGVENPNQSEEIRNKIKQTCIEKYGTENAMQNTEIQEKSSKNAYKSKEYIMPSGKIVKIQGYENITLDMLLKTFDENDIFISNKEIEEQIGTIWYIKDNKKHRYYPDFYVKSINKIFETKSIWTYQKQLEENIIKKETCLNMCLSFEFLIYNNKNILI